MFKMKDDAFRFRILNKAKKATLSNKFICLTLEDLPQNQNKLCQKWNWEYKNQNEQYSFSVKLNFQISFWFQGEQKVSLHH